VKTLLVSIYRARFVLTHLVKLGHEPSTMRHSSASSSFDCSKQLIMEGRPYFIGLSFEIRKKIYEELLTSRDNIKFGFSKLCRLFLNDSREKRETL